MYGAYQSPHGRSYGAGTPYATTDLGGYGRGRTFGAPPGSATPLSQHSRGHGFAGGNSEFVAPPLAWNPTPEMEAVVTTGTRFMAARQWLLSELSWFSVGTLTNLLAANNGRAPMGFARLKQMDTLHSGPHIAPAPGQPRMDYTMSSFSVQDTNARHCPIALGPCILPVVPAPLTVNQLIVGFPQREPRPPRTAGAGGGGNAFESAVASMMMSGAGGNHGSGNSSAGGNGGGYNNTFAWWNAHGTVWWTLHECVSGNARLIDKQKLSLLQTGEAVRCDDFVMLVKLLCMDCVAPFQLPVWEADETGRVPCVTAPSPLEFLVRLYHACGTADVLELLQQTADRLGTPIQSIPPWVLPGDVKTVSAILRAYVAKVVPVAWQRRDGRDAVLRGGPAWLEAAVQVLASKGLLQAAPAGQKWALCLDDGQVIATTVPVDVGDPSTGNSVVLSSGSITDGFMPATRPAFTSWSSGGTGGVGAAGSVNPGAAGTAVGTLPPAPVLGLAAGYDDVDEFNPYMAEGVGSGGSSVAARAVSPGFTVGGANTSAAPLLYLGAPSPGAATNPVAADPAAGGAHPVPTTPPGPPPDARERAATVQFTASLTAPADSAVAVQEPEARRAVPAETVPVVARPPTPHISASRDAPVTPMRSPLLHNFVSPRHAHGAEDAALSLFSPPPFRVGTESRTNMRAKLCILPSLPERVAVPQRPSAEVVQPVDTAMMQTWPLGTVPRTTAVSAAQAPVSRVFGSTATTVSVHTASAATSGKRKDHSTQDTSDCAQACALSVHTPHSLLENNTCSSSQSRVHKRARIRLVNSQA